MTQLPTAEEMSAWVIASTPSAQRVMRSRRPQPRCNLHERLALQCAREQLMTDAR